MILCRADQSLFRIEKFQSPKTPRRDRPRCTEAVVTAPTTRRAGRAMPSYLRDASGRNLFVFRANSGATALSSGEFPLFSPHAPSSAIDFWKNGILGTFGLCWGARRRVTLIAEAQISLLGQRRLERGTVRTSLTHVRTFRAEIQPPPHIAQLPRSTRKPGPDRTKRASLKERHMQGHCPFHAQKYRIPRFCESVFARGGEKNGGRHSIIVIGCAECSLGPHTKRRTIIALHFAPGHWWCATADLASRQLRLLRSVLRRPAPGQDAKRAGCVHGPGIQ